jgi:hypothetical protein
MKLHSLFVFTLIALLATPWAAAQTVQVPGTYATIQAAIDSFNGDSTPADNVIEITTVGPHTGITGVQNPVTIRGAVAGGAPAIILLQSNSGDGLIVNNGSPYNRLENLILIPDAANPPTDDGIWVAGAGTVCHFDKVLACPNNGLDAPLSLDGLPLPDFTGAVYFGDEVVVVDTGAIMHATDTILTSNLAPGLGTHDLLLISGSSGAGHTINKGCVFSFANRYCVQINNSVTIRGTTSEPVIFNTSRLEALNTTNGAAVGFFGNNGGTHVLENVIIANAFTDGIFNYTGVNTNPDSIVSIDHVAIVNSNDIGLRIWTGQQPLTIANSTFVNNGNVYLLQRQPMFSVDRHGLHFCGGNGAATANAINNAASPATMVLTNCAVVQSGAYSVAAATNVVEINGGERRSYVHETWPFPVSLFPGRSQCGLRWQSLRRRAPHGLWGLCSGRGHRFEDVGRFPVSGFPARFVEVEKPPAIGGFFFSLVAESRDRSDSLSPISHHGDTEGTEKGENNGPKNGMIFRFTPNSHDLILLNTCQKYLRVLRASVVKS